MEEAAFWLRPAIRQGSLVDSGALSAGGLGTAPSWVPEDEALCFPRFLGLVLTGCSTIWVV